LRERPEDIDPLVDHFIKRYDPHGRRTVSMAVRERFRTFSWPGNVRQLENEIRRMLLLGGRELSLADISPGLRAAPETAAGQTLRDKLNDLERQLVVEALEAHRGNRTRAAEALGVSRFGLQKMMQRLAISVE
jgi:DNA-binding NtrC family response regulator